MEQGYCRIAFDVSGCCNPKQKQLLRWGAQTASHAMHCSIHTGSGVGVLRCCKNLLEVWSDIMAQV